MLYKYTNDTVCNGAQGTLFTVMDLNIEIQKNREPHNRICCTDAIQMTRFSPKWGQIS